MPIAGTIHWPLSGKLARKNVEPSSVFRGLAEFNSLTFPYLVPGKEITNRRSVSRQYLPFQIMDQSKPSTRKAPGNG